MQGRLFVVVAGFSVFCNCTKIDENTALSLIALLIYEQNMLLYEVGLLLFILSDIIYKMYFLK